MADVNIALKGAAYYEGEGLNVVLKVKDYVNQKDIEVSIPRYQLNPKTIKNVIIKNGGICQDAKAICKDISKQFDKALQKGILAIKKFHSGLGWNLKDEKIVFAAEKTISVDDSVDSSYSGNVDVKERGSIEAIKEMIEQEIVSLVDWSPLEAVLAFGAGATILSYANIVWNESLNNVLIHLLGGSSSGKSTALGIYYKETEKFVILCGDHFDSNINKNSKIDLKSITQNSPILGEIEAGCQILALKRDEERKEEIHALEKRKAELEIAKLEKENKLLEQEEVKNELDMLNKAIELKTRLDTMADSEENLGIKRMASSYANRQLCVVYNKVQNGYKEVLKTNKFIESDSSIIDMKV